MIIILYTIKSLSTKIKLRINYEDKIILKIAKSTVLGKRSNIDFNKKNRSIIVMIETLYQRDRIIFKTNVTSVRGH